jgi:benzodiazapine receptor
MDKNRVIKLFVAIAVCQMAGFVGSIFTSPSITTWYASIEKPAFTPPNWLFAPVWILLFTLMGIALYLVWEKGFEKEEVRGGLSIFSIQLVGNMGWSMLFFGIQSIFYAFLEIVILWVAILITIHRFWNIDRRAAYLLVPYILWVSLAAVLNFYIWVLNP